MIYKSILTSAYEYGYVPSLHSLSKTAGVENLAPAIQKALTNFQPEPGKAYVVVTALGSGEYWGPNRNGDYFPEDALINRALTTYRAGGLVYRQHANKDPKLALGKIIAAGYNTLMRRVELLLGVDESIAPDIAAKIRAGEPQDVSMGASVPYDVCSICGHKSRTRLEYCDHLKNHMLEFMPDGRQVYAINEVPTFFDISFVKRGADPTAKTLLKVASDAKTAEMKKRIPLGHALMLKVPEGVPDERPGLSVDGLRDLATLLGSSQATGALASLGIIPTPKEFYALGSPTNIPSVIRKTIIIKAAEALPELFTSDTVRQTALLKTASFSPYGNLLMNILGLLKDSPAITALLGSVILGGALGVHRANQLRKEKANMANRSGREDYMRAYYQNATPEMLSPFNVVKSASDTQDIIDFLSLLKDKKSY